MWQKFPSRHSDTWKNSFFFLCPVFLLKKSLGFLWHDIFKRKINLNTFALPRNEPNFYQTNDHYMFRKQQTAETIPLSSDMATIQYQQGQQLICWSKAYGISPGEFNSSHTALRQPLPCIKKKSLMIVIKYITNILNPQTASRSCCKRGK